MTALSLGPIAIREFWHAAGSQYNEELLERLAAARPHESYGEQHVRVSLLCSCGPDLKALLSLQPVDVGEDIRRQGLQALLAGRR